MATLQAITSGNFTSATTWAVADAATFVDSTRTTAFQPTSTNSNQTTAFTPGAITISGISLNMQGRTATPTGTMTVRLWNNTAGSIVKDVVVNISDLPSTYNIQTTPHIGWVYFKFDTNVTLLAATAYAIRVFVSSGSQVSIYTSSLTTIANLSKALITTTTQAPVASDILLTSGTYTTAAGPVTNTVTMNNTAATVFGLISIAANGVMNFGTASSTNYLLTLAGSLLVGAGGTLTIGTASSPIPSTSTATLQLTCTTALQYVMLIYGTMITYGSTKTVATKLAADVIVGATNSTTSTSTSWSNGDLIVVPSTTRTYTQYELLTLSANASGTNLTHGAYVNAHDGSAANRTQADIVNLTRNIIIRSTTGTLLTNKTNLQLFGYSVTSFYYTAFLGLGTGVAITNSGICLNTLSGIGTFDFQYNVVREIVTQAATTTANTGLQTDNTTTSITISNNVFYLIGWTATVLSTISASINDNNYFMGCLSASQVLNANYAGSGNVFTSNNNGASVNAFYNNSSNCSFYSHNSFGLSIPTLSSLTTVNNNLSNFRFWRNNVNGLQVVATNAYNRNNILSFTGSYFFGNTSVSLTLPSNLKVKIYFSNSYFYGGTTLVQGSHFTNLITNSIQDSMYYDRCYFGYSDSSLTSSPFSGAILTIPTSSTYKVFSNCYFNSTEATVNSGYPYTNLYGGYRSLNHNGVTASNKEWTPNGTITSDLTIYLSSNKSTRLTPNSATYKLTSPVVRVPVKSGNTCTISVSFRRSTTITGFFDIYNGNHPRLMYAFNPVLGNLTETIGVASLSYVNTYYIAQQNFNNTTYWTTTSLNNSINQTNSPDGRLTATKPIILNGFLFSNTNTNIISGGNTYNIGDIYTFSIYAKKELFDAITIVQGTSTALSTSAQVKVNLNNGAVISSSGTYGSPGYSVETLANGWYRISVTKQMTQTTNNRYAIVPGSTTATQGDGTSGIYIWGAQIVQGTDPGVYTPSEEWLTMSYTTATFSSDGIAEFYVDCDGTAGWINIDDWNTTTANDSRAQDYWGVSGVYIEPTYKNPTRTSGYIN